MPKESRSAEGKAYQRLYWTARWKRIREALFDSEPYCRMCSKPHKLVRATVADHVIDHHGDEHLFFNGELQPLCKTCHDSVKQRETKRGAKQAAFGLDGFPVEDVAPQPSRKGLGPIAHPAWFRPVFVPLTIVCGPPAAGKSTYVQSHAGKADLVIDLDAIALAAFGKRVTLLDGERLIDCLKQRNQALADLMWKKAICKYPHAWLIVAEPDPFKRQWWADTVKPARIAVLETSEAECLARAAADKGPARHANVAKGIKAWWRDYHRRDGDEVICN